MFKNIESCDTSIHIIRKSILSMPLRYKNNNSIRCLVQSDAIKSTVNENDWFFRSCQRNCLNRLIFKNGFPPGDLAGVWPSGVHSFLTGRKRCSLDDSIGRNAWKAFSKRNNSRCETKVRFPFDGESDT